MKNQNSPSPRELIENLNEEDFLGSTNFNSLTPSQKLEWLAQAAEFVHNAKKARKDS